jgi:hypothetical protein
MSAAGVWGNGCASYDADPWLCGQAVRTLGEPDRATVLPGE